ncbi:MAG: hypothetical protein JXR25_03925 [Pontiellaceae bacterium]|nr:hypothetical protein [Pontiellaceae bacterium]MBN2783950.1 hypothetical protein [Pontiellaceae bacterium]
MSLQWISILLGVLATAGGLLGIIKPNLITRFAELFPRSVVPALVFTALCCLLGAYEAHSMNMGFLNGYKHFIYFIAVAVFAASVIYMKELLAPRALGGFLLLIAVPIITVAKLSEKPFFQVIVALVYVWILYGLILLMSPWWFRRLYKPFENNPALFKAVAFAKTALGIVLILLGIFVYA